MNIERGVCGLVSLYQCTTDSWAKFIYFSSTWCPRVS